MGFKTHEKPSIHLSLDRATEWRGYFPYLTSQTVLHASLQDLPHYRDPNQFVRGEGTWGQNLLRPVPVISSPVPFPPDSLPSLPWQVFSPASRPPLSRLAYPTPLILLGLPSRPFHKLYA